MYNHKDGDICCQLLEKKYLRRKTFARCNPKKGSQFWQGVNRVKHKLKFRVTMVVNNGENTQFWEDAWAGGPRLSSLSQNCMSTVGCLVSECYDKGDWYMDFRRTLTQGKRCNGKP
jgi:hypothetical protein